jgi:hypothetical protein
MYSYSLEGALRTPTPRLKENFSVSSRNIVSIFAGLASQPDIDKLQI